ncbi:MAG: hypothetical protein EXQ55_00260 [Acidobacteria bacterium]|nr:hypothetical protein [Acidobacteriota bacterium]
MNRPCFRGAFGRGNGLPDPEFDSPIITSVKLHQVLFDELYGQGIRQISGIPGDFVLNLYEALSQDARFQLITLSHEPAVGFAADGASRITNGLAVCVVTYGAGGLNLLNSVACAYAEESPLIIITGGGGQVGEASRRAGASRGQVVRFTVQDLPGGHRVWCGARRSAHGRGADSQSHRGRAQIQAPRVSRSAARHGLCRDQPALERGAG